MSDKVLDYQLQIQKIVDKLPYHFKFLNKECHLKILDAPKINDETRWEKV